MLLTILACTPAEVPSSTVVDTWGPDWTDDASPTDTDAGTPSDSDMPSADTAEPEDEGEDLSAFEGTLRGQIESFTGTLPEAAKAGYASWGTWEVASLNPRLYLSPLGEDRVLVGFSGESGTGWVAEYDGSELVWSMSFEDREIHGTTPVSDGGFGVLLRGYDESRGLHSMWLRRYDADRNLMWEENQTDGNRSAYGQGSTSLGDSRLEFSGSRFAVYFAYIDEGSGHSMDAYRLVYIDEGTYYGDVWGTGCSHGMGQLVRTHPENGRFVPVCSSDAYPSPGIYSWHDSGREIYGGAGDGAGAVSAQVGGMAATADELIVAFNAEAQDCCDAKGVGVRTIDLDGYATSDVTWLTDTDGAHERDAVVGRIGAQHDNRYLVGWRQTDDDSFRLGVIDASGSWQVDPEVVSVPMGSDPAVQWGRRDDSMRTDDQGRVTWGRLSGSSDNLTWWRYTDFATAE